MNLREKSEALWGKLRSEVSEVGYGEVDLNLESVPIIEAALREVAMDCAEVVREKVIPPGIVVEVSKKSGLLFKEFGGSREYLAKAIEEESGDEPKV